VSRGDDHSATSPIDGSPAMTRHPGFMEQLKEANEGGIEAASPPAPGAAGRAEEDKMRSGQGTTARQEREGACQITAAPWR
jgi:hypothetical protein